jgi:hypothetical protein
MIMKKLIAIAVVFTLAVGGVFAADIGATVFTGVNVMEGNTADDSKIMGSGSQFRLRLEGSGENDDGTFGAWLRFEPTGGTSTGVGVSGTGSIEIPYGDPEDPDSEVIEFPVSINGQTDPFVSGLAWWKPIDQFKLTIGGNPDGLYGKEGYAGWMFYQMPSDVGIVIPHSVWGGPYLNPEWWRTGAKYRNAFYGGFGDNGLMLDIKPVDMFGLNIILPYFGGGELANIFKNMTIQLDFNLDFGNIALTYDMASWTKVEPNDSIGGTFFLYFGLSAIDNLSLDLGIGFPLPHNTDFKKRQDPVAVGLAAKFDVNDSFGFKARLLAQFMGKTDTAGTVAKDPFILGLDLLPYIGISDNLKAYIGLGLVMVSPDVGDSIIGFHFNPYLQVGAEWGPTFYAGVRVFSYGDKGVKDGKETSAPIHFEIPIGLQVSF